MGVNKAHGQQRDLRFFIAPEAAFGTFVKPVAGDAVKVKSTKVSFSQAREDRNDNRSTRSTLERITGKKTCS